MNAFRFLALATAFAAPLLRAQMPPNDPVGSRLFMPEFIAANADVISLSESQQEKLRAAVEKAQKPIAEATARLREEADSLGKLIETTAGERTVVMAQFEKVQDRDRDLKRAQLDLLLDLRALLNEEQRVWLTQLKAQQLTQARDRGERAKTAVAKLRQVDSLLDETRKLIESAVPAERPPSPQVQQLQDKVARVKAGVEKWRAEGRDAASVAAITEQVGPLMQAGKAEEAGALLDRALRMLGMK
jgi:Spy/CpxP family protein refolding chaperone